MHTPALHPTPRLAWALALAAGLALLSALPGASAPMPAGAAWIDQPLSGSTHPLGPVTVTVHATDPTGVGVIHLWVDDAIEESVQLQEEPRILATHLFTWNATEAGQHLLTVRSVGKTGDWSAPATAIVTIDPDASPSASASADASAGPSGSAQASPGQGASAAPTAAATPRPTPRPTTGPGPTATPKPTPVPTPKPTPVPTPRPTPVPCTPPPPFLLDPDPGEEIRDPSRNPPTFRWTYRGSLPSCTPTGYRVQVFEGPDLGIKVLDVTLGNVSTWTPPTPLADCTEYSWRVAARGSGGVFGSWSSASTFRLFIGRCP